MRFAMPSLGLAAALLLVPAAPGQAADLKPAVDDRACADVTVDSCESFALCYAEAWNTGKKATLEKVVTEDATRHSSSTLKSRTVLKDGNAKSKTGLKMLEDKIKASKKDWKDFEVTVENVSSSNGGCEVSWRVDGALKEDPDTPVTIRGSSGVKVDGSFRMVEETVSIQP